MQLRTLESCNCASDIKSIISQNRSSSLYSLQDSDGSAVLGSKVEAAVDPMFGVNGEKLDAVGLTLAVELLELLGISVELAEEPLMVLAEVEVHILVDI